MIFVKVYVEQECRKCEAAGSFPASGDIPKMYCDNCDGDGIVTIEQLISLKKLKELMETKA